MQVTLLAELTVFSGLSLLDVDARKLLCEAGPGYMYDSISLTVGDSYTYRSPTSFYVIQFALAKNSPLYYNE